MKNILITLTIITLGFSSCTKIIDIDQEDGDARTMIEANLYAGTNDFRVKVTKTGNFFGDNSPNVINNATINLSDGVSTFPVPFTGNGTYILPSFNAVSGTEYTLLVDENGNSFEAKATIPNLVPIDSITYEFFPASAFSDEGYITTIEIQDPASIENYYRIQVDKAGEFYGGINDLILLDDGFLDGNRIEFPIFAIDVAQANDTVRMDLFSCDKATFTYLEGVDALLGGGNGAPPANPTGNFNNQALGNFSVYAKDSKSVVIIP